MSYLSPISTPMINQSRVNPNISADILSADPGFHQRNYSESELAKIADFDEEASDFTLPRQRNPFVDGEAQVVNDSFVLNYSDHDTIDYSLSEIEDIPFNF